ncbi:MAG: CPBP family intramembrane metalloprotease [Chloroflexi bacterium]|nr:MAG: CPBP family intramembrane metalloprotease [Chloroflexota bacterium]
MALRARWIPGVVATYAAHAWLATIALTWYFLLGRHFPIGGVDARQLRPWYLLSLVITAVNAVVAFAAPPASMHVNPVTLAAQLVALALVVGPSEELLFRGVIQTSLNRSIHAAMRWRGWRLPLGTLFAAVLFGLFHLVNLGFQPLATTLEQVVVGIALGLVIGVLYDRTGNLIGAGLFHSVADFSGTALPFLAYVLVNR